jgi:DNA-binding XRE family transcriptional regulator
MDHPGRGVPYSVRTLAQAAGVSRSLIGHLLTGERDDCDMKGAHAIAEVVGVAVLVLFAPPASPNLADPDMNLTETPKE